MKRVLSILVLSFLCFSFLSIEATAITRKIPANSKVYVASMDGFETYIIAAMKEKDVPVQVVADRERADYEIRGTSETEKAGWARTIFTGQTRSNEQASITLADVKTSEIIFAYSVNKVNAFRGKQSAAEACAKHMKDFVEKPGK
jgi:hypothetical protein